MLKIHDSSKTLAFYMDMEAFKDETKKRVRNADIILLPDFEVREGVDRAFQPDTVSFYKYSIINNDSNYRMEIFENKGEEKILSLHSYDIWIPTIYIATSVLLPFTINLISNYVYDRIKGRPKDEPDVHFKLIIENQEKGISKQLFYSGPFAGFEKSFKKIDINKLWED